MSKQTIIYTKKYECSCAKNKLQAKNKKNKNFFWNKNYKKGKRNDISKYSNELYKRFYSWLY